VAGLEVTEFVGVTGTVNEAPPTATVVDPTVIVVPLTSLVKVTVAPETKLPPARVTVVVPLPSLRTAGVAEVIEGAALTVNAAGNVAVPASSFTVML
jgi:hypothetical protein